MAATFPLPKYHFEVRFSTGGAIEFQEVSGLDLENEFVEYRDGNDKEFIPKRRVSLRKSGTTSFKKGLIKGDDNLINIYNKLIDDKDYYSGHGGDLTITVILLDQESKPAFTWEISNAVPIKLSTEGLNSTDNSLAIEQIDFSHSGIKIVKN